MNKNVENQSNSHTGIRISARLRAVSSFVPKGSKIADIGTDHGYVPIYLVQNGLAEHAVAMDLREGPLERARAHVAALAAGQRERIELRLSDGMEKLRAGEAGTVIIAGMGGDLVVRILLGRRDLWDCVDRFILSPQSELDQVRLFLEKEGFAIAREMMILDEGKYYTIMEAVRGQMKPQTKAERLFGRDLIQKKDATLRDYLKKERLRVEGICKYLSGEETPAKARAKESLQKELRLIEEAQNEMQGSD